MIQIFIILWSKIDSKFYFKKWKSESPYSGLEKKILSSRKLFVYIYFERIE